MGWAVAVPVGPICLMCIRETLNEGRRLGLTMGLGTSLGDALFGAISVFGLAFVTEVIEVHITPFRIVGGMILLYLGVDILLKTKHRLQSKGSGFKKNYPKAFVSTFLLTLANPMTIFAFLAFFTLLNFNECDSFACSSLLVLGVFLGALSWWLFVVFMVGYLGKKLSEKALTWVNMASGILIVGFGVAAIASIL